MTSTGVAVQLPTGATGRVTASPQSDMPATITVETGILDATTQREVFVLLHNSDHVEYTLPGGTTIAQLMFISDSISSEITTAYPTDSKVREQEARRAAKAAGEEIVRVKRKKHVEDHNDDCGEDLSSISTEDPSGESTSMFSGEWVLDTDSSDEEDDLVDPIATGVLTTMLYGPTADLHHYVDNLKVFVASNIQEFSLVSSQRPSTIDIAEICGGQSRTSKLAVRKRLKVGSNFDLVTHTDLADPRDARSALEYFKSNRVAVAVMAPCCDCYGPLSHLNWSINYDTMLKKYKVGSAVAKFCGAVALLQLKKGLHFICEQPDPSDLYCEGDWPAVFSYPGVHQVKYDRCQCGLKVQHGAHKGLFIRKPSTMTVSCRELSDPFQNLKCQNRHEHLHGLGHGTEHSEAQVWTWNEAERVLTGCLNAIRLANYGKTTKTSYPVTRDNIAPAAPQPEGGVTFTGRDPDAPPAGPDSPCTGCRHRRAKDDPEHSRVVGQCGYPYDQPRVWECDACFNKKPRFNEAHTYEDGKCKWASAPMRASHKRAGRHPRDPATAASAEPTAGLPGNVDGRELGADADDAVEANALDQINQLERDEGQEIASSSSRDIPRRTRGPDTVQRTRTTTTDLGTGPGGTTDWSNFDVAKSMRTLRLGNDAQQRLTLRKLHLRWWHASPAAMTKLLERAGCPQSALDKIKEITDTCSACRAWAKPKPDSVASLEMPDTFNKQVEYDIVFIYKFSIFHLVDRCTRWEETYIVDSKSEDDLIDALDIWISRHGPMTELIGDGESGIMRSDKCQEYLRRKGVKPLNRGKDQHARIAERRGALLRDCIHRIDAGLESEGINHIPFKHRLSEATFCLNALLTINNASPYNAVYGRVPKILPDINCPDSELEHNVPAGGLIRHTNRLREIAVQSIVDGTAKARLGRALKTKTLPTGEREGYQVGEDVDIYRAPGTKDVSGWHGPAKVVDLNNVSRGIISVRSNNVVKECKVGDVRRHLAFLCFLACLSQSSADVYHTFTTGPGWSACKHFVESLAVGHLVVLGEVLTSGNRWQLTRETQSQWAIWEKFYNFGRNHLRLDDVKTIRAGHGVGSISKLQPYSESLVLYWDATPHNDVPKIIEQHPDGDVLGAISWQSMFQDNWRQIRFIQFCLSGEDSHVVTNKGDLAEGPQNSAPGTPGSDRSRSQNTSRLSTIPEEESQDFSDSDVYFAGIGYLDKDDVEFVHQLDDALKQANAYCSLERSEDFGRPDFPSAETPEDGFYSAPYLQPLEQHIDTVQNYHVIAANVRAGLPPDYNLDEQESYVELSYDDYMWKTVPDVPREPLPGEVVIVRMYLNKGNKRIVNVERDDALLTPAEIAQHKDEVNSAMAKELQTWAKYQCISRKPRNLARNVIDCKWVLKWKWDEETLSVDASAAGQTAKKRRVIRARLTIRGFKDVDKGHIATYAGTSQRYSQRIIISEAVNRGWDIATTDISKAFLQGVTYQELAELTGEPVREVNFYLPAYNIPQLRQISGYETFDPNCEVLHCDKPGTGSVDAPRCFSLKLAKITKECGLIPSNVDPEFCYLHEQRGKTLVLVALITKHVDDLKCAGERHTVIRILTSIQKAFGLLKITWNNFTNCGVRHIQDATTKEASLDQTEYVSGMKTIPTESYRGLGTNSKCEPVLHVQYQSLLGAVAYTGLTRLDVIVFIVALQRYSHAPEVIHVKRLNILVRWMQKNPRKLCYKRMPSNVPKHLKIIGDSSFKKEEEKGHSLRGVLIVLCSGSDMTKGGIVHILDFATKALRLVTRSTFSAELLGGCDSFDLGLMILFILNEIHAGVPSKLDARSLRENGGFSIPAVLCLDALSVFAAVTATYIKPPAEKGLLAHVQYLRELLDRHVLYALMWLDTRDMTADGMTKGAVERLALHLLMAGEIQIKHEPKLWKASI